MKCSSFEGLIIIISQKSDIPMSRVSIFVRVLKKVRKVDFENVWNWGFSSKTRGVSGKDFARYSLRFRGKSSGILK